jgi:hypothetical protein
LEFVVIGYPQLRGYRWTPLAVAALFMMGAECGGDGAGTPEAPGPGNAQCRFRADYPHESSGKPGWIDGKVRGSCTAAIDSLTVEAKVQQLVNGSWVDVSLATRPPISPVVANEVYTAQANLVCPRDASGHFVVGVYRTAGRGFGVYGGVPNRSSDWVYNPEVGVEVKCRDRK